MSLLKKFGKWAKKNVVKVAAIAAPIAALAIPGVGGAVSNGISKVLGKIKNSAAGSAASEVVDTVIAPKPSGSGGLFGKGGLFGTGALASTEWDKYNKTMKWAKKESKVLKKAADLLGVNVSSIEDLKKKLSQEQINSLEAAADQEIELESSAPPGAKSNKMLLYGALGLVAAKVFKLI